MNSIGHITIPRSGNHLLNSILWNYFTYGEYLHCESYAADSINQCCAKFPCLKYEDRARHEFGSSDSLMLHTFKSHDFDLSVPFCRDRLYIVQFRGFLKGLGSWLRYEFEGYKPFSVGEFSKLLYYYTFYYLRFINKWGNLEGGKGVGLAPRVFLLSYDNLVSNPTESLCSILDFLRVDIDDSKVSHATSLAMSKNSHNLAEKYISRTDIDAELLNFLSGGNLPSVLNFLKSFLPSGNYLGDLNFDCESDSSLFDRFAYFDIVSSKGDFFYDFKTSTPRKIDSNFMVVNGPPNVNKDFGFADLSPGVGVWMTGDYSILPFKITVPFNKIIFKLKYKLDYMVRKENFCCELMVNGELRGVYHVLSEFDELVIDYDFLNLSDDGIADFANVGLFFRIFDHSVKSEDKRNISVLFENISLQVL